MPSRSLRSCAYPGCPELVRSGYCVQHQAERQQQERRLYRDPVIQRLYKSARWLRLRDAQLAREPWCAECLRANTYTEAEHCDHIEPHNGDPTIFFRGPFQSLCPACHSRKTSAEVWGRGGKKFPGGDSGAAGACRAKKIPNVENPLKGGC